MLPTGLAKPNGKFNLPVTIGIAPKWATTSIVTEPVMGSTTVVVTGTTMDVVTTIHTNNDSHNAKSKLTFKLKRYSDYRI